jgi:hypothetical protein
MLTSENAAYDMLFQANNDNGLPLQFTICHFATRIHWFWKTYFLPGVSFCIMLCRVIRISDCNKTLLDPVHRVPAADYVVVLRCCFRISIIPAYLRYTISNVHGHLQISWLCTLISPIHSQILLRKHAGFYLWSFLI